LNVTRAAVVETDGSPGAGLASISFHYDQSNDFFALWLDPTMTYSSALWQGATDDLQTAQLRKLDYLIGGARAAGARRVLDIGCGWGSLLRRLTDEHGVERAHGITLSEAQVEFINRPRDPRYDATLENWQTHEPGELYDAIISIGAIEHFVRLGSDEETRRRTHRDFFEHCRSWMAPGGRLALQTVSKGDVPLDRQGRRDLRLIVSEIFPNIDAPWLAELVRACDGLFEVTSLRNDRMDYARTLMEWRGRLAQSKDRAAALVGAEVVERHEDFFAGSARHFALGQAGLLRIVFQAV
jgi:cyclopropane-fatty-acyl-phospholipid synthase